MSKLLRSAIMAALVMSFLFCGTAFAKSFVNGIDLNFPPYGYVDKTGKPAGFDVESVNWMAKKLGFEVRHQPMEWSGIIPALTSGKIDFIASGMSITKERQKVVNFTIPYKKIAQVLVAKKGSTLTPKDVLYGEKKLGYQRGTTEGKWFEEHGKDFKVTYKLYDSSPLAVQDLILGRIDAAAMDSSIAKDIAKKKPIVIIGEFGMEPEYYGYAVRKEDKELLETLNKGLEMIMKDPVWQELKDKYDVN